MWQLILAREALIVGWIYHEMVRPTDFKSYYFSIKFTLNVHQAHFGMVMANGQFPRALIAQINIILYTLDQEKKTV